MGLTRQERPERRAMPTYASNDQVERRGAASTTNKAGLSQSSTYSLAHRRRDPRSLEPIVRCHPTKPRPCPPKLQFLTTSAAPQTQTIRAPLRSILRQPAFPRKRRSRLRVQRSLEMLRRLRATDLPNEVVLIGPTKCASSGAASTRTALSQQRVLRPAITDEVSSSSWQLTIYSRTKAADELRRRRYIVR